MKVILTVVVSMLTAILLHIYWTTGRIRDNFISEYHYDYIIVGGGTAGCVLANRLSRNATKRILIIEAGAYPGGMTKLLSRIPLAVPFLIGSSIDWQYWSTSQSGVFQALKENKFGIPAGKVFGGTTSINAMIYTQGQDADYDSWDTSDDWSLKHRERIFKELVCENTTSEGCLHTSEVNGLPELTEAFLQAGRQNDEQGFIRPTVGVRNGERRTVFDEFIIPILSRPNLYRLTEHQVTKVLINEMRQFSVVGVEMKNEYGEIKNVLLRQGGEVILSAGSMATPRILLGSGIGPESVLKQLNIPQIIDLPVGEYVQDHPFVGLYFTINDTASLTTRKILSPEQIWRYIQSRSGHFSLASGLTGIGYVSLNTTSGPEVIPINSNKSRDLELLSFGIGSIINDVMKKVSNFDDKSWETFKPPNYHETEEGFLINVVLLKPKSRGKISLTNIDNKVSVDFNHLSDPDDKEKLITGVLYTIKLIQSSPLYNSMGANVYLPVYESCRNYTAKSREAIECLIRHVSVAMYHISSSCRMGKNRRTSVVDTRLRVHGMKALRIVDASALPTVPSAHPSATIMMLASRAAEFLLGE